MTLAFRFPRRAASVVGTAACLALLSACAMPAQDAPDAQPPAAAPAASQPPLTLVRPELEGFRTLQEKAAGFELSGPSACHYVGTAIVGEGLIEGVSDQEATAAYLESQVDKIGSAQKLEERSEPEVMKAADGTEFMAVNFMYRPRLTTESHGAVAVRVDVETGSVLVGLASCDALDFAANEWSKFIGSLSVSGGSAGAW
ncbi:MAG: hypothetical protein Q3999_04235 [Buchananella hordeovulneris]|nr:hypothetical protein [Buchananella hordeovulneris]